jgi:hypothetical protein
VRQPSRRAATLLSGFTPRSWRWATALALALVSCTSRPRVVVVPPDEGRLTIRFAPSTAAPYYDLETLRERVGRLTPEEFSVVLRGGDVERFITDSAPALCLRLVLTEAGARRLRSAAAAHRGARARAATGRLEHDLDMAIFVAELDGRRIFEGQVWLAHGAAAFDTPAMQCLDAPAPGALLITPTRGMWSALGPGGRSPIDHAALRAYFSARNALEERRGCALE